MTSKNTRNVFPASIWSKIEYLYPDRSPSQVLKGSVEIFNILIRLYFNTRLEKPTLNVKVPYQKVCELFKPTRKMNKCQAKEYWERRENMFDFTTLTGRLLLEKKAEWELQKYLKKKLCNIYNSCFEPGHDIDWLEKRLTCFFRVVNGKGIRKDLITGKLSMRIVDNNPDVFVLKEGQLPEKFSFTEVCGIRDDAVLTFNLYRRKFLTKFFPDFVKI